MAGKFFRMALANLGRYAMRTGLTAAGLALAIAAVLFVNAVALSFESGTTNVYDFIRQTPQGLANVWITPPTGFQLDKQTGFFTTQETLPASAIAGILQQNGDRGLKVLTAKFPSEGLFQILATTPQKIPPSPPSKGGNEAYSPPFQGGLGGSQSPSFQTKTAGLPALYGCSTCKTVILSRKAARTLQLKAGDKLKVKRVSLLVDAVGTVPDLGAGGIVQMPLAAAQQILEQPEKISWVMLQTKDAFALRQFLTEKANVQVTTDPTVTATNKNAIAYFLEERFSRADMVGFNVKLAAIYFNQAGASLLGWLAKITLGLGFVLMLTAALLSIEERKREFGIFAAVGVSSDVFYLFLLESLLLFFGATAIGLVLGMGLLGWLVPTLFDWGTVLKSAALVICYLPPMVIFGSLVPAQKLLQKSPLELIRSA